MPVSVWHDPKIELPECSGEVLAVVSDGAGSRKPCSMLMLGYSARWQMFNLHDTAESPRNAFGIDEILCWAYPDDILPDFLKGAFEE